MSKRFIFVGIEPNARAWRLWDKHTQRIFITGDAVIREDIFPAAQQSQSPSVSDSFTYPQIHDAVDSVPNTFETTTVDDILNTPDNPDNIISNAPSTPNPDTHSASSFTDPTLEDTSDHDTIITDDDMITEFTTDNTTLEDQPRQSSRRTTAPIRYGFAATSHNSDHPTYCQAMASPDKAAWLTAMQDEFEAFKRHSVGTLFDAPSGVNILGGMWVFNQKCDEFH